MTRSEAKKRLLTSLMLILERDDELFDAYDDEPDYPAFDGARKELVAEFLRRAT